MNIDNFDTLKKMNTDKQLVFAYLTCERLYPNYVHFSNKYGFADKMALREAIDFIHNNLYETISFEHPSIPSLMQAVELNTPTPEDFETILASSALDACSAILETLSFMHYKNELRIDDISTFATDTVNMFIHVKYDLDFNTDKEFEQKIFNHPLMQKELNIQKGIISYLSKVQNIEQSDINTLLDLQANNGKGNIDIS